MKVIINGNEIELDSRNAPSAITEKEAWKDGYKHGKIHGYKHAVKQLEVILETLKRSIKQLEHIK